MRWFEKLVLRLRSLFKKDRVERELDKELHFHLERQIEADIAAGASPEDARCRALRSFGGVEQIKEECRDARAVTVIDTFVQDTRYGLRMLRGNPGFTAVAVLSLALGIGANTAIFSLVDAVMLKSLPVSAPEQLVILNWSAVKYPKRIDCLRSRNWKDRQTGLWNSNVFSWLAFDEFRGQNQSLSDIFAFAPLGKVNVSVNGQASLAGGLLVSGTYFSCLGVHMILGRPINEADDKPNAEPVAMISYRFWERAFGRDPSIVGKAVRLNGVPFTIVGVTPRQFFGVSAAGWVAMPAVDVSVPLMMQEQVERLSPMGKPGRGKSWFAAPDQWWLQIMGRLKPGISKREARADLDRIYHQTLAEAGMSAERQGDLPGIELRPGGKGLDFLRLQYSDRLSILMAIVGLVLLVACVNLAALLLAQAMARQKEITVRIALGASRSRLIRQLLTESLLLAVTGGTLGLLCASWGVRILLAAWSRGWNPIQLEIRPDARVLFFTTAVSLLTGLLFGLVPAVRATHVDLSPGLKENPAVRWATRRSGAARFGLGKSLIVCQVALSLLLLVGAGLFVRTLQNLKGVDLGFNPERVLLFGLDPTLSGYRDVRLSDLYAQVLNRLESIPGVLSASMSAQTLISDFDSSDKISIDGTTPQPGQRMNVAINHVGPRFFETMDIPLLLGRGLGMQDAASVPKVAVINETAARRYFGSGSPLGKTFRWQSRSDWQIEVIGVVKDAKYARLKDEIPPTVYVPYLQNHFSWGLGRMYFEVRTAADAVGTITAVRAAVREIDKDLPLIDVKAQVEQIDQSLSQERLFAKLSGFFGALALILACIGLYGIMAYSVTRRVNEIGIRMALGAQRNHVLWLVLRETILLVAVGIAGGIPAALATTRLISSMLFGLKPTDTATIIGATLLMAAVALFAGYLPARRASRVDPIVALRYE